jgi:hypothetical protein
MTLSLDDMRCILDFLDDHDDNDLRSLRSLCLACKTLNQLIQPRLFHQVDLCVQRRKNLTSFTRTVRTSTSFGAFRELLEISPHLAHYPRILRIVLNRSYTEDIPFVIAALTGKAISFITLTMRSVSDWMSSPVLLKAAVETFFKDTVIPLNVILSNVRDLSGSSLHFTEHVALVNSFINTGTCASSLPWTTRTFSTADVECLSLQAIIANMLPCLTHLMMGWYTPWGNPGQWYEELGMALSNLPALQLLTVNYNYNGKIFFVSSCVLCSVATACF